MASWRARLAEASNDCTLQRAGAGCGKGTVYTLGKGGFDPTQPMTRECDCSGFVAWAIGIPRELPPGSDQWLATDNYWQGGSPVADGLFGRVAPGQAQPGDLYVYPDAEGRQGHIGIITRIDAVGKPTHVVHCSLGNFRTHGDAVQETEAGVFVRNLNSHIMRVDYGALRALFDGAPSAPPASDTSGVAERLRHELLRDDPTLRRVVAEHLVLHPSGARVAGCAAVQDGLNYLAPRYPEYYVDLGTKRRNRGSYGPKTVRALKHFQAAHNIQPDGLIGHDTALALDAALLAYDANQLDSTPPECQHPLPSHRPSRRRAGDVVDYRPKPTTISAPRAADRRGR
jgi:peptidoglycan hydrolase-like protein with peptidoglycan-binding domain